MIAIAFPKKTTSTSTETWTRPAEWLALPAVPAQGAVGLCAVPPEGAYIALKATTSVATGGKYLVDWGDGTPEVEWSSASPIYKVLEYSAYSNLTTAGYKQAIVKITPKAGQNLTVLEFPAHTSKGYSTTNWLDLEIKGTTALTSIVLGTASVFHRKLQRVKIHDLGNVTSLSGFFRECSSLREVILPSTAKITTMSSMFLACESLTAAPAMDTSNVASMSSMFQGCYKLKSVPTFNTAKVTTMLSMFSGCIALENVQSTFSTGACTTLAAMFQSCYVLKTPPSFTDTSKVTNISSMFNGCFALQSAPEMSCVLVTNIQSAFANCVNLTSLPSYSFPKAITDARYFISNARKLKSISNLTFSSTVALTQEFASNAISLSAVPALNLSTSTNNGTAFNRCYELSDVASGFAAGAKATIDFRYCGLSAASLNQIFNALGTIPLAQTTKPIIYILGNPGTSTCTASIATTKNWVVNTTSV